MNDWDVRVVEGSSEQMVLPSDSVHLVLTDPPYHDDVQYAELSARYAHGRALRTRRLQEKP
jgi:adenine-specific DNA methylase